MLAGVVVVDNNAEELHNIITSNFNPILKSDAFAIDVDAESDSI